MENTKRLRVMVGCNLLTSLDSLVYPNHMQMWYRFGRSYPDIDFFCCFPRRVPIDVARNLAVKHAIINECDYIFFYDDDVIVPLDALSKLLACNADVAAGLTYIRGGKFHPMIFDIQKDGANWQLPYTDDFKKHADENGHVECYAVGFSCALLKLESLKKLKAPYFMTGTNNTEDIYYCCKLKDYYPDSKIVVDTTINTSHLLDRYYVNDDNVEKLREFFGVNKEDDDGDRSFERAKRSLRSVACINH